MSLTKDAIQHLETTAIAAASVMPHQQIPTIALPDDMKIHNLERFAEHRARFRGEMVTSSIADFSSYVLNHGGQAVAAFVDQDRMACRAFFNLGTQADPGHGDDTALLALKPTAAYAALLSIAGEPLTQRELAEWMEDWAHCLTAYENGAEMSVPAASAAVRNITIKAASERTHSEHNFGAARSAMDEIEAKSQDRLPTELVFITLPYEGLERQSITLRVSVITGEKPSLKLRWVREEAQREEIAQDFKRVIQQEIDGGATVTLGTFQLGQ